MKGIKRRILGILLSAIFLCSSMRITVSAAEPAHESESICLNLEVTSEGIVSVTDENGNDVPTPYGTGSISGYKNVTLNGNDVFILGVTAEGFGGMGVTFNCSSSWNGYMKVDMKPKNGDFCLQNLAVSSNGETTVNNLWQFSPSYFYVFVNGIPEGQSVNIQIWVYG